MRGSMLKDHRLGFMDDVDGGAQWIRFDPIDDRLTWNGNWFIEWYVAQTL